jgi:hypothetical protein
MHLFMDDFHDSDDLYRCIHPDWWIDDENRVSSQAFSWDPLSVDWSKHCTPSDTQNRLGVSGAGVASLGVGFVRKPEFGQKLVWKKCPPEDPENIAHCHIIGRKSGKVKSEFARNCEMVIKCAPKSEIN